MTTTPDPTPATPSGNDASGHDFSGTDPWAALDAPPAPNASGWVRQQLEDIHAAGTTDAASVEGRRVVVLTMLGKSSGQVREVPLMRVEHDGVYAAVASKGGAPEHPQWFHNLTAHPHLLLQDGSTVTRRVARLATDAEHAEWWPRCVEAFPPYADYQTKTDRQIPVFLLEEA
ncbi:nitroreductase family deazaflavin-dependent oxidoreductase [Arsenicicoccus sp. UBA7492]|uniref:nitroreductase family deazaflavin-dependent oxidoreductase n=1 Tax=Arsenicicoccus sp. UBA7492 TaxID=1946057 RepID=UPI00257F1199|nr:nitroreductase family deazaflavin-dependent oxidoreductase [Arsenicicoccus sp. UBA7492]